MEKSDKIVKELKKLRVSISSIGWYCISYLVLATILLSYLARGGWGVFVTIVLGFVANYYIAKQLLKLERELGLRDEFDNYID